MGFHHTIPMGSESPQSTISIFINICPYPQHVYSTFWQDVQTEDFDSTVVLTTTEGLCLRCFSDHHQECQSGLVCCLGCASIVPEIMSVYIFWIWRRWWYSLLWLLFGGSTTEGATLGNCPPSRFWTVFGGAMVGIVCCVPTSVPPSCNSLLSADVETLF